MMKYTLKQLKDMRDQGAAIDLTSKGTNESYNEIMNNEGYLSQIGYAAGVYGCNGKLFKGHNSGSLYVITARTNALFIFS